MTATEPQPNEPERKRPWHHRASVWFELVLGVLTLAGFLLFCVEYGSLFNDYDGRFELSLWAGLIAAFFVCRHRPVRPLPPWCFAGILGVVTLALAITISNDPFRGPSSPIFLVFLSVFVGVFFLLMVWTFVATRQQFTLQTLMLVTLGIALLCSVSCYVPIVPLLILLGIPATAWAWPKRGAAALCRGKDGPKNLKSQISNPESEFQNPKSKI